MESLLLSLSDADAAAASLHWISKVLLPLQHTLSLSLSLWGPLSADKTAVVWFLSRGYGSLYLEFS